MRSVRSYTGSMKLRANAVTSGPAPSGEPASNGGFGSYSIVSWVSRAALSAKLRQERQSDDHSHCLRCDDANDGPKGPSADAPQPVEHDHEHRQHWKREQSRDEEWLRNDLCHTRARAQKK